MDDSHPRPDPPKRSGPKVEIKNAEALREIVGSLKLPKLIEADVLRIAGGKDVSLAANAVARKTLRSLMPDRGEAQSLTRIADTLRYSEVLRGRPMELPRIRPLPRAATGEDMARLQGLLRELHEEQEAKRDARARRSARQTTWNVVSGVAIALLSVGLLIEPLLLR